MCRLERHETNTKVTREVLGNTKKGATYRVQMVRNDAKLPCNRWVPHETIYKPNPAHSVPHQMLPNCALVLLHTPFPVDGTNQHYQEDFFEDACTERTSASPCVVQDYSEHIESLAMDVPGGISCSSFSSSLSNVQKLFVSANDVLPVPATVRNLRDVIVG